MKDNLTIAKEFIENPLTPNVQIEETLGSGCFGSAFLLSSGLVLKMTKSKPEYHFSSMLMNHHRNGEGICKIHHTWEFHFYNERNNGYYNDVKYFSMMDKVDTSNRVALTIMSKYYRPMFRGDLAFEINSRSPLSGYAEIVYETLQKLGIEKPDVHQENMGFDEYGRWMLFDLVSDYTEYAGTETGILIDNTK